MNGAALPDVSVHKSSFIIITSIIIDIIIIIIIMADRQSCAYAHVEINDILPCDI